MKKNPFIIAAAVVGIGGAIYSTNSTAQTTYRDAQGNIVSASYYNSCGNTQQPTCATKTDASGTTKRTFPLPELR